MECAICYEKVSCRALTSCTHSFCFPCLTKWMTKGSGEGCPMCREPINFKGLDNLEETWEEEKYAMKADELFGDAVDMACEEHNELREEIGRNPRMRNFMNKCLMDELKAIEKTHRFLTHEDVNADLDDIESVHYERESYSDHKLNSKNQHRERTRSRPPPRKVFNKRPMRN